MSTAIISRTALSRASGGFTLLEILIAVALVGVIAAVALPSYANAIERQKIGQAGRDLMAISLLIEKYRTSHFSLPQALADLGSMPKDPWGFDYRYLNFDSPDKNTKGLIRKDHNLHPLNTEMDLYSVGPDGDTKPALTAQPSRDDIIWARDGGFVGVAEDF